MRILVIGAGEMGRRHAGLIAGHPDCRLAGIVDPRDDAARGLDAPQFRDLDAVSGGVDAALIATPNAAHCAAVIACLDRGWPVLVEKPVTATLEEAEAVKTAAAKSGLPVLVGHHRRFHPCVGAARSLIAAGVLGRLALVQFIWAVRKPDGYFADRWRVQAGGGPVMINLIHEIDMLRYLCGEITDIRALGSNAMRQGPVEDSAVIAMRLANGALATAGMTDAGLTPWSWEAATGENPSIARSGADPWHFAGSEGALSFPSLTLHRYEGDGPGDWSKPLSSFDLAAPEANPFRAQLDHFLAVLRGEAEPLTDAADAAETLRATLAVADAIAAQGGMVSEAQAPSPGTRPD